MSYHHLHPWEEALVLRDRVMAQEAQAWAERWMRARFLLPRPVEALAAVRRWWSQYSPGPRLADRELVAQALLPSPPRAGTSPAWVEAAEAPELFAEAIPEAA
jgi:hypothetical protein